VNVEAKLEHAAVRVPWDDAIEAEIKAEKERKESAKL